MRIDRIRFLLAIPLAVAIVPGANATVGGGSNPASDCYVEFDGISQAGVSTKAPKNKPLVVCSDGDSCDGDATQNNSCTFNITPCSTSTAGCTPQPVKKYKGKPRLQLPAKNTTPPACGTAGTATPVVVKLKKKKGQFVSTQKVLKLTAVTGGSPKADVNTIVLQCDPPKACTQGPNPACPTDAAGTCANNPSNGPREVVLTTGASGTDLDNGVTGTSHNFPVVSNGTLQACLAKSSDDPTIGCNGTDSPRCLACGATGAGTKNGPTFGAPLPLFAASVPVCVVNRWQEQTVQGTYNVQTGEFESKVGGCQTPVKLFSDVFLTNPLQVCPRCVNGHCNSGAKAGQACTINGSVVVNNPPQAVNDHYDLSSDCPPDQAAFQATLNIQLPLTTGTSTLSGSKPCPGQTRDDDCGSIGSVCNTPCDGVPAAKGGFNQICCGDGKTPCFPTSAASGIGKIERSGKPDSPAPVWPDPTYPKSSTSGKIAATFCEDKTGSVSIDTTSGLPGPGALILTGKQCVVGNNGTPCP